MKLDEWKGRPCVDVTTAAYASTIDFVRDAERENLAIPKFQRGYVWGPSEALALVDSMMRGYPIGNLLIWYPESRGIWWPTSRGIVLDGQQRITTLRGALLPGASGGDVPRIAFDLVADDFVILDGAPTQLQFPIAEAIQNATIGFDEYRQIVSALGVPDDSAEREARRMAIWRSIAGDLPPPRDGKRPKQIKPAAWARAQAEWAAATEEFRAKEAPLMAPVYRYSKRLGNVMDRLRYHRIAITAIRGGELQDVREIFRRINTAGRPLDEAAIDALLNGGD